MSLVRMALSVGARLGVYEILAAIGLGGMGACGPRGAHKARRASAWGWGPMRIKRS